MIGWYLVRPVFPKLLWGTFLTCPKDFFRLPWNEDDWNAYCGNRHFLRKKLDDNTSLIRNRQTYLEGVQSKPKLFVWGLEKEKTHLAETYWEEKKPCQRHSRWGHISFWLQVNFSQHKAWDWRPAEPSPLWPPKPISDLLATYRNNTFHSGQWHGHLCQIPAFQRLSPEQTWKYPVYGVFCRSEGAIHRPLGTFKIRKVNFFSPFHVHHHWLQRYH